VNGRPGGYAGLELLIVIMVGSFAPRVSNQLTSSNLITTMIVQREGTRLLVWSVQSKSARDGQTLIYDLMIGAHHARSPAPKTIQIDSSNASQQ
jgi:hypothetical protein